MCKEAPQHGLGRVYHSVAPEREAAKRDEPLKRGRFIADAQDFARLRPSLVENARR